ncbi:MAG: protein kinase [Deltaproteobacteria bacterium]|nr:protein kinase [Deltaproteobacteria bacterium]
MQVAPTHAAIPDDVELLETLGEGSFGQVFVARMHEGAITRTVVLKVLKQDWSKEPETLRRSRDEAAMLARLNHDNIVRVERLTTFRGHVTVVMEHLLGLSLDRLLAHHGPLPTWCVLEIASRVCSALNAAHTSTPPGETKPLRIIHRDIKPSNILLTVSGAVKVLDFGAARGEFDAREAETRSMAFGTVLYMAPECFDAGAPTPAVDMFALGATMVELLDGKPLGRLSVTPNRFWPSLQARLAKVRPVDLPEGPALDALMEVISRILRYDAARRPDAAEFRTLLRKFMSGNNLPRYGLDQLGEAVVDPLFRKRKVLPAVPPDGSMLAPVGVLGSTPPPTPKPPGPAEVVSDQAATIAVRRGDTPIISRREAASPVSPLNIASWPKPPAPRAEKGAPGVTPPAPRPPVGPSSPRRPPPSQATEVLEELELDDDPPAVVSGSSQRRVFMLAALGLVTGMIVFFVGLILLQRLTEPTVAPATAAPQEDKRDTGEKAKLSEPSEPTTPANDPTGGKPTPDKSNGQTSTAGKTKAPNTGTTAGTKSTQAAQAVLVKAAFKSLPAGAKVTLGQSYSCTTPCDMEVPSGKGTLSVTFPGISGEKTVSGTCSVNITANASLRLTRDGDSVKCP